MLADLLLVPGGSVAHVWVVQAYGLDTCAQGDGWREGFENGCAGVTLAVRPQTRDDNAQVASRRAR